MSDATDFVKNFLRHLVAQGVLTPPVTINGQVIDLGGGATVPVPGDGYLASGWKFTADSPMKAPLSRGVENLRAELTRKGYPLIAQCIPKFHVVRHWYGEPSPYGWGKPDLKRFALPEASALPEGVTIEDVKQIRENQIAISNQQFAMAWVSFEWDKFWRGEDNGQAFEPFNYTQNNFGNEQKFPTLVGLDLLKSKLPTTMSIEANMFTFTDEVDIHGTLTGYYKSKAVGGVLPDHWVYDVHWDVRDDKNITRYWRGWAKASGANIEV
jgi:hypothetical protein